MGLFKHHPKKRIVIDDQAVSVDELVEEYNQLSQQFAKLQEQLSNEPTLTVDGQQMTAGDVQRIVDQWQNAASQAKSAAAQVTELKAKNAELEAAQSITLGDKPITVDELIDHYNDLLKQLRQANHRVDQLQDQLEDRSATLTVDGREMTVTDVQKLIDGQRDAANHAKTVAVQLAEVKAKNAELTKKVQDFQGLKMGGKPVTIDEVIKNYNDQLDQLQQAQQEIQQLQAQLKAQSTSLTVNGQKMTAADVQKILDQRQSAADQAEQLAELKAKNADLTKSVDKMAKRYQELLEQFWQAQGKAGQSTTLTVNGQKMTATDVQKLIAEHQDTADQLKKTNTQLKTREQELDAAKQVIVNNETMPVTELIERYCRLLRRQPAQPDPQSDAGLVVPRSDTEKLIDRYYQAVKTVLGNYQDQVAELQQKMTKYLEGHGQDDFLQLVERKMSASTYQKSFADRNQQMIRYIENHQYQENLVRPENQEKNPHDELRGINYWGNFVYRYRKRLAKMLDQNQNVHHDFKYAYRYAKSTALEISKNKPSYLSDQNVLDLRAIYSGIKNEQNFYKTVKRFRDQADKQRKGAEGERVVRNLVKSYTHNRVLTSLNLPYQYRKGEDNSNQIDCIVINQHGIFILEIKNYTADAIGIAQDGTIVTKRNGKTTRYPKNNIIEQGRNHYQTVRKILEADEALKPYIGYVKKYLRVVYVSTNPHAKIMLADPNADHQYNFTGLDGLREYIDSTRGNLRPDIIQWAVEAIGNHQQAEKRYDHVCFPDNPVKRVDDAWGQFMVMKQLLDLKLDDFVDKYDPEVRRELDKVGLVTRDGFVTSKPHNSKQNNN